MELLQWPVSGQRISVTVQQKKNLEELNNKRRVNNNSSIIWLASGEKKWRHVQTCFLPQTSISWKHKWQLHLPKLLARCCHLVLGAKISYKKEHKLPRTVLRFRSRCWTFTDLVWDRQKDLCVCWCLIFSRISLDFKVLVQGIIIFLM